MAKRSPLKVLLFLILLLVVAYLCKRGIDGFYDASTGVYCIAEVGTPDDPWATTYFANFHWIQNAPYKGPVRVYYLGGLGGPPRGGDEAYGGFGLYWIWGVPNSGNVGRPDNEAFTFYHSYNNTTGTDIKAKMYGGADNYATVTINGQQLPRFDGSLSDPYHVTLRPGNNNIQIFGQNGVASPAGVWLMIKDDSDRILVKTDCTNWSTSPPAAAAPAPAAAAPACNSCAAPNACVDMTPYMLKAKCLLTDDDQDPRYMLIEDCCPTCKQHRQS
jgi:hypothetical protein